MQKTWIEVSRSALRKNIAAILELVKPAKVMAVVKANAYGHGLVETSKAVQDLTDWFGVDSLDEAAALRKNGIKKPILILGYIHPSDISKCADLKCSFVAYNVDTLKEILKDRSKRQYRIHLKIETGTSRQGLSGTELDAFALKASKMKNVVIEGTYTHFANIEDTTDPSYAMEQIRRFKTELSRLKRLGIIPELIHAASTAGALLYSEARFDMIRLGISLYGCWPSKEAHVAAKARRVHLDLAPALTWKTIVAQVKQIPRGTPVSYGLTERVTRPSMIAVLPIGYFDGYDRKLSSIGRVLIHGRSCKVLGRVCMNMTVVDVTDVPNVKNGDEVVLLGSQKNASIPVEDLAAKAGTISYEFLARISQGIERIVVK